MNGSVVRIQQFHVEHGTDPAQINQVSSSVNQVSLCGAPQSHSSTCTATCTVTSTDCTAYAVTYVNLRYLAAILQYLQCILYTVYGIGGGVW